MSSDLRLNASMSGSSDYVTLDIQANESRHHPIQIESIVGTPSLINVDHDEAARMDAEQNSEHLPADITDVAVPNDNAVFVIDESISNTDIPIISTTNIDEQSDTSDVSLHEMNGSSDVHDNDEQTMQRRTSR
jgi:hypothetical protein